MTPGLTGFNIIGTLCVAGLRRGGGGIFQIRRIGMIRFSALVAAAFALAVFVGGSLAQAQSAADRKTQPGNSQCRLSNGQKC
jgi:hypothetical protein